MLAIGLVDRRSTRGFIKPGLSVSLDYFFLISTQYDKLS